MKLFATFLIATIICTENGGFRAQPPASNPIELHIANQQVAENYDLDLSARLISKWRKPIAVPSHFTWGQLSSPDLSFLLVELQRKVGRKYREVILNASILQVGPFDVDSLYGGDTVEDHGGSLAGLTRYPTGDYRVRVLCRMSDFNPGMKNFYSNWLYFTCIKEVRFP